MTARKLIAILAQHYHLTFEQVKSSRVEACAKARWICWYLLREDEKYSYPQIAREFECDHSAVMYGVDGVRRKPWFHDVEAIRHAVARIKKQPVEPVSTHCAHCGQEFDTKKKLVAELGALLAQAQTRLAELASGTK